MNSIRSLSLFFYRLVRRYFLAFSTMLFDRLSGLFSIPNDTNLSWLLSLMLSICTLFEISPHLIFFNGDPFELSPVLLFDNPEDDFCDILRLLLVGRSLLIGRLIGLSIRSFMTGKFWIGSLAYDSSVTSLIYSINSIYPYDSPYSWLSNICTCSFTYNSSFPLLVVKHGVSSMMLSCLSLSGVPGIFNSSFTNSASTSVTSPSYCGFVAISSVADWFDYLEVICCDSRSDSFSARSSSAALFYSEISSFSWSFEI